MNDRDPVPVAVVGGGNMGANHIRVYDELPEAKLVAVVETDPDRAQEITDEYGVPVFDRVADLDRARAVTVAVPSQFHREVAEECAAMGLDLLVEKPLALSVEDAKAIVASANDHDVILQVGHIERFNPAVQTLEDILENQKVIAVEAHRLGPFNEHLSAESVVFDLMIHDIDVVTSLVSTGLSQTSALGTAPRSEEVDHAVALFKFEDGVLATTTASHVTHGKIRTMTVTTENAYISLNYQKQDVIVQRRGVEQTEPLLNQSGYRTETVTENPYIKTREPLKVELHHFLSCCRDRTEPRVDGRDGIRAVELAGRVIEHIGSN